MLSIRNLSIPRKLVGIILIISSAALLLASLALVAYDALAARRDLMTHATTLAEIVADNISAAVLFRDQEAAHETLASIRFDPAIVAACVYSDGRLFAEVVRSGETLCPEQPATPADSLNYILANARILEKGKPLGDVQLRATLEPAYAHLRMEIATVAVILFLAILFAYALSSRFHKLVSEPILNLTQTANAVSHRKDYSIRAAKQTEDELGVLVDAFNEMLAQIQTRDADLRDRTAELSRVNRMKDEFLATLSHELRTPLTSILAWAVMLRTGMAAERHSSALEAIERNARVQARLVEDLLDVSRIISGKFTMDSSDVGLKQIIENAVEVVRPAADAKRIRLQFLAVSENVHVLGDAARLQQAVWNLLSNAVKFTGEHGFVEIRLESVGRHARLAVADNGVGISPDFLPFVFDRFRQADSSSVRPHGGLGLGLAIVRHIVELHGGSVNVNSQGTGYGTTFTVELPLISPQVAEPPSFRLVG